MVYEIHFGVHARKYLKKLKDRSLKRKIINAIYDEIAADPYSFSAKAGDLRSYYTYSFNYQKTAYRIAYAINDEQLMILIILVGTHEEFYKTLKRIIKKRG